MSKTILKFFKPHGPYVTGDIAGFDTEKAAKLKSVARPYDAKAEKQLANVTPNADTAELDARAADLDAREAALKAREDALAKEPDEAAAEPAGAEKSKTAASGKGEPPAQGGKASKG